MHITIEQNKEVVNLDAEEFPKHRLKFRNLDRPVNCACEFREFGGKDITANLSLLPMHLCRTIGEANLSEDPFATMTLYPFWKFGFAFGSGGDLIIAPDVDDPHKKAVAADEFGMGFTAWAMEEIFHCESWADATALLKAGYVEYAASPEGSSTNPSGRHRCPDFVCTFPDGSLGIFEAKGTTGTASALTQSLKEGKYQAFALDAQSPIKHRVVVGTALGEPVTKVILMDPPPSTPLGDHNENRSLSGAETPDDDDPVGAIHELPLRTNLTADLVRSAAMKMRQPVGVVRERPGADTRTVHEPPLQTPEPPTTIFRGPTREIALTNELKPKKNHSWLDINT